jgi:hypothetical protein
VAGTVENNLCTQTVDNIVDIAASGVRIAAATWAEAKCSKKWQPGFSSYFAPLSEVDLFDFVVGISSM